MHPPQKRSFLNQDQTSPGRFINQICVRQHADSGLIFLHQPSEASLEGMQGIFPVKRKDDISSGNTGEFFQNKRPLFRTMDMVEESKGENTVEKIGGKREGLPSIGHNTGRVPAAYLQNILESRCPASKSATS